MYMIDWWKFPPEEGRKDKRVDWLKLELEKGPYTVYTCKLLCRQRTKTIDEERRMTGPDRTKQEKILNRIRGRLVGLRVEHDKPTYM